MRIWCYWTGSQNRALLWALLLSQQHVTAWSFRRSMFWVPLWHESKSLQWCLELSCFLWLSLSKTGLLRKGARWVFLLFFCMDLTTDKKTLIVLKLQFYNMFWKIYLGSARASISSAWLSMVGWYGLIVWKDLVGSSTTERNKLLRLGESKN